MALAILKVWALNERLDSADLNAAIANIHNNALALVSPWTGNMDAGTNRLIGLSIGSVSNPSLQPTGDTNTGIYFSAADKVDVTAGGVRAGRFNTATSGVNFLDLFPAAAGSSPILDVEGTDVNIGLILDTKGTGTLDLRTGGIGRWRVDGSGHLVAITDNAFDIGASGSTRPRNAFLSGGLTTSGQNALSINPFGAAAGNTGEVRFLELAANGTQYVGFKASDSLAGNVIWTLPIADGTSGQTFQTNGSGILSFVGAVNVLDKSTSDVTVTNTVTETNIYSFTLPAGTLGTDGSVYVDIIISDLDYATGGILTVRLKYGGSTVVTVVTAAGGGGAVVDSKGKISAILSANGATNAQTAILTLSALVVVNLSSEEANRISQGTSAVDSTVNQTMVISVQWDTASVSNNIVKDYAIASKAI